MNYIYPTCYNIVLGQSGQIKMESDWSTDEGSISRSSNKLIDQQCVMNSQYDSALLLPNTKIKKQTLHASTNKHSFTHSHIMAIFLHQHDNGECMSQKHRFFLVQEHLDAYKTWYYTSGVFVDCYFDNSWHQSVPTLL